MKLTDIRKHGYYGYSRVTPNYQSILIFLVMASFVLLIACINFMNLATARSTNRAKEIGLRKTIGAARSNVALQLFSESILMTGFALIIALILAGILLPAFNSRKNINTTIHEPPQQLEEPDVTIIDILRLIRFPQKRTIQKGAISGAIIGGAEREEWLLEDGLELQWSVFPDIEV